MQTNIRKWLKLVEGLAQERVHRNTTVPVLKALARNASSHCARFVIANGELHAGDAEAFTHYNINPTPATLRGWVYCRDDHFSYKAVGIYDMHPKDDPLLRYLERAGIERVTAG